MHTPSLCLFLAIAATVHSAAVPNSHVIHERRNVTPSKWVKRAKLSPRDVLPMRIGLKQRNLDRGHDFLMEVSHPDSKSYSKHWTPEEIDEMFAPDQDTVDMVMEWLMDFGIDGRRITHSDNKGWLAFDATTDEAERLFHTSYSFYEHSTTGHVTPACDSYRVPSYIQEHVDYITPGVKLLAPTKRGRENHHMEQRGFGVTQPENGHGASAGIKKITPEDYPTHIPGSLANCDVAITPSCIRALYGIPKRPEYPRGKPRKDNSLGIFEEGDYYAQEDLDLFFANFSSNIPQGTSPTPAFIDGAEAPVAVSVAGGESDLDFELAYPIIYPQKINLFQTDDLYYATNSSSTSNGGFNTFLDAIDGSYCTSSAFGESGNDPNLDPVYPNPHNDEGYQGELMCGKYKPTNVISVSYGGQEADLPHYYQMRQCYEFMKLGLQGISVFYASGDDGVAGPPGGGSDNGCLGNDFEVFSPAWPNNCPYVTNVGATKVYPGKTVFDPESAVVDPAGQPYRRAFSSGGGFSNIYGQPTYQQAAVAAYFDQHDPGYKYYSGNDTIGTNGGRYNRLGRAYPDVAANGDNIAIFNGGKYSTSGGTSASTPIFASIINRINELRLNAGKKTIGFINPVLYAHPEILNDITNGTNPGCGTDGFAAVPGWDPVTGLGTPNYPKMVKYFMSLP